MNENISLTATIFITDKCNLACKYCYEENKQYQTIKKEYIDKFIDLLYTEPQYSKRKYIVLDFIGGEALLEWSLMEYAMTRFLEKGRELHHPWVTEHRFTFFNTTNGTLFGEPSIRDFLNRWKCLRVGVSLDGCKKAHDMNRVYLNGKGSYDKVMENMEWWKHRDHEPMVKGTMNHDTLPMLADMLINQIQLGFEPWANPIYEQKWTKEDAEEYYRQLRKVVDFIFHRKLQFKLKPIGRQRVIKEDNEKSNYCGSGVYMVTLGMDGKLYPCHRFATGRHRYDIGDIWHGFDKEKFKRFREGQDRINEQIGSTKLPLCYSANYDIDGTFDYHNNEEIMTEQEYRIYDYWMERMKEMNL